MVNNNSMTPKHIILIISLVFFILTIFRLGWIFYFQVPDHPDAQNGVIDLRDWKFSDNQTITLDGEWAFYPNDFLSPETVKSEELNKTRELIHTTGNWKEALTDNNNLSNYGHGTYHLKIILPENNQSLYGIYIKRATTAMDISINDIPEKTQHFPSESAPPISMPEGPFSKLFHTDSNEIELIIHVSNYELPLFEAISNSVKIGTDTAIVNEVNRTSTIQMIVSAIYLLHCIYAFIILYLGKNVQRKTLFYYSLLLIFTTFSILIDNQIIIHLPGIEFPYKLHFLLLMSVLFTLLKLSEHLFQLQTRFLSSLYKLYALLAIAVLLVPLHMFQSVTILATLFYILTCLFLFNQIVKAIRNGYKDAIFILIFIVSYTSNGFWGVIIKKYFVSFPYYPVDFIVSLIAITLLLFTLHIRTAHLNEEQTKKLQKADKEKDEFLANTSHELRNPLHGIMNITETILKDQTEPLTANNKENLQLIIRLGKQMTFTLNDILDITKLQEQRIQLHTEQVNLHAVTTGVIDMIRFMTEGKNLAINLVIPSSFPKINADKNRLIQILFNLIHNAVKFTNEGSITINASHQNNIATITIADTGIGMDKKIQPLVFEPYQQADASATSIGSGIGLGLTICKQLVALHGGEISVASAIGGGSVFTFTMPLANEPTSKLEGFAFSNTENDIKLSGDTHNHPINQSLIEQTKNAKILIVDDDPMNLKILKNILIADYHIVTATSGEEALTYINSNEWDLVISDVMMPNMSGYQLTEKIRKQFTISELPILLLTARNQIEDIYAGFLAGANDYVAKPMDSLELQARVRALTTLKQSINEQLRIEAAWLQAQIQPHFLFNTLNTIAALGVIDTIKMREVLDEFSNYLRRSFDIHNTNSLIPLENELDLIRSYLFIEKERFRERIQVEWEIDDELELTIPPFSLQTIVENAIRHGILKRVKGGTICIRITNHEAYYKVSVIDDGIGMSEEKIQQILHEQINSADGIGIANTNRRLKQLYGKGLTIISKPNYGTTVSFQIPK